MSRGGVNGGVIGTRLDLSNSMVVEGIFGEVVRGEEGTSGEGIGESSRCPFIELSFKRIFRSELDLKEFLSSACHSGEVSVFVQAMLLTDFCSESPKKKC